MRKTTILLCSFAFILSLLSCQQKAETLLLGGSGWNKIVMIDKTTKAITWEYSIEKGWECNSVAATKEGNILFSYSKGARLITPEKQTIWNVNAPEGCEMQTASILPDGNFLLAYCGNPAGILEVNQAGEVIHKTEFDTQIETPHAQFRQVTKNSNGNYMVPLFATSEVREIKPDGTLAKSVKVEGNPFCVVSLPNGHWLVSGGDAHCLMEINFETGETIRKVNANDIEGATLAFVAQLLPTPKDGLYICNWQGHDNTQAPQLIEVDKAGKMVWSLNDNETFGMISAIAFVK